MDRYEVDGLVFDLTDVGPSDADVIVLLHGFPATRACWDGVIPRLAGAGYRVLAPDQRGYSSGARPRGRRAYRLDRLALDVVALGDAVGAGRMHVVGHDLGGAVAWSLAMWHPERLFSVTSLTTPHPKALLRSLTSSAQLLQSWYMVLFQLPWLAEMALTGPGRPVFRRRLRRSGLPDAHLDRYLSALTRPGAATSALNWYRGIPLGRPSDLVPVTVPTLYVYPTNDAFLSRKAADLTARQVTGPYRYEILDGASHWIPEEVPDVLAALILTHVHTHGAGTT
ncbi:MAG: alpha/beta fold hydrolase [Acidimicrobiia bacterium]